MKCDKCGETFDIYPIPQDWLQLSDGKTLCGPCIIDVLNDANDAGHIEWLEEEKKPTLEDCARYFKVIGNPQKLAIVLILYASERLEEMEIEWEAEG